MNTTAYQVTPGYPRPDHMTGITMPTFDVVRAGANLDTVIGTYRSEAIALSVAAVLNALADFEV